MKIKCPECEGSGRERDEFCPGLINTWVCGYCNGTGRMTIREWLKLKRFIFKCWIAEKMRVIIGPPCVKCRFFRIYNLTGNANICDEAMDGGRDECRLSIKKYLKYRLAVFIERLKEE